MRKKHIIRVINEEISKYTFPDINEQDDFSEAVKSKEFQTQLIHDLAANTNSSKFENWQVIEEHNSINDMDIEEDGVDFNYDIEVTYNFNGNKLRLVIYIEGDNVPFSTRGTKTSATYLNPAEHPEIDNIALEYADIDFFIEGGEPIEMAWLEKNPKLKEKVIRKLLSNKMLGV